MKLPERSRFPRLTFLNAFASYDGGFPREVIGFFATGLELTLALPVCHAKWVGLERSI